GLEAAAPLMARAESWLAAQGMETAQGPFNFSTNEECGLLVDGFDTPPTIMMTHTRPDYPELLEKLGYRKAKDLLAYKLKLPDITFDFPFLTRFSERARGRIDVNIRAMDSRSFVEDVRRVFRIYNRAWSQNWGFVPMTEAEFEYTARALKPVVDFDMALIAEIRAEPVAFILALPDFNQVFKKMNGRLLPLGIFHYLFGRRAIDTVRVITLGVVKEHRKRGIDALLIHELQKNGVRRGYRAGEFSWVLEDNVLLRRMLERMGADCHKTYRIYEKNL
ncbi:MAG: N-acetyltransferase, partial [Planctomycetes bacterium]|nr:N-acetyltransferase [Planctomycetota bacterium]